MPEITIDGLVFTFPVGWIVEKYDDWAFYKNKNGFQKVHPGKKAVDLIAVSPNHTVWLLEVKDYRQHPRTKPSDLSEEIAVKVVDTLAAMIPAKVRANNDNEINCAREAAKATGIRVVLHLEQPRGNSKLFPRVAEPLDIQQSLRQQLHPIDPHAKVAWQDNMSDLPWSVRL